MTSPAAPDLKSLPDHDLLAQYADMVRWRHYDPHGAPKPSVFEEEDLEAELRWRLARALPETKVVEDECG